MKSLDWLKKLLIQKNVESKKIILNVEYSRNKLKKRVSLELLNVLQLLKTRSYINKFKTIGPGWQSEVFINNRKFVFNSEYSYITVSEFTSKGWELISVPDDLRTQITNEQLALIINQKLLIE